MTQPIDKEGIEKEFNEAILQGNFDKAVEAYKKVEYIYR